jgi:hypothetical protein
MISSSFSWKIKPFDRNWFLRQMYHEMPAATARSTKWSGPMTDEQRAAGAASWNAMRQQTAAAPADENQTMVSEALSQSQVTLPPGPFVPAAPSAEWPGMEAFARAAIHAAVYESDDQVPGWANLVADLEEGAHLDAPEPSPLPSSDLSTAEWWAPVLTASQQKYLRERPVAKPVERQASEPPAESSPLPRGIFATLERRRNAPVSGYSHFGIDEDV